MNKNRLVTFEISRCCQPAIHCLLYWLLATNYSKSWQEISQPHASLKVKLCRETLNEQFIYPFTGGAAVRHGEAVSAGGQVAAAAEQVAVVDPHGHQGARPHQRGAGSPPYPSP